MIFSMNFGHRNDHIRERKMRMSVVGHARGRPIEQTMNLTEYDPNTEEPTVNEKPLDKWFQPISNK